MHTNLRCSPGGLLAHDRGSLAHLPSSPPRPKLSFRRSKIVAEATAEALVPTLSLPELETPVQPLRASPSPAKLLWGSSGHVHAIGVQEAESLYLSLCERSNDQHVLLVVYSSTCPHSRAAESEVERLAAGLSGESSLRVVCLNADTSAARYFAKDVLGLQFMPSFVLFPAGSRTFYKYKGKARDADSLTRFLNIVCNQNTDTVWQLGGKSAATNARGATTMIGAAPTPALAPSGSNSQLFPGVGLPHTQVGLVGGLLMGVAALGLMARVLLGLKADKKRHAAYAAQASTAVDVQTSQQPPDALSPSALVQEIDGSLSRMSVLMVQLMGARVGLSAVQLGAGAGGRDASPAPSTMTVDTTASASVSTNPTEASGANRYGSKATSVRGATVAAASVMALPQTADGHERITEVDMEYMASAAPGQVEVVGDHVTAASTSDEEVVAVVSPVMEVPVVQEGAGHEPSFSNTSLPVVDMTGLPHTAPTAASATGGASSTYHDAADADTASDVVARGAGGSVAMAELELMLEEMNAPGSPAPASSYLPGQGMESRVTGESARVTQALSADELMALLDAEGSDVRKVLDRLAGKVEFDRV